MISKKPHTPKILLIGWDAADWKVMHPLMDAGEMPTLKHLVETGAAGNLATLDPPLSPIMWTSIGTGMTADKHGVLGFTQPRADGAGIQPVLSSSRKVKAVWNILKQQGYKTHVIGWWPSHPAEKLNGVTVSNFYHRAVAELGQPWPMPPGCVQPEALTDTLAKCRVHPQELTGQHILPFIPDADQIDFTPLEGKSGDSPEQTQNPDAQRVSSVAKITAECASVHAAATWVMENEPWDFMAVYYDAIDHYSHGFMKYHPPHREGIPKDVYERYQGVVEGAYRFHDMMLERLIKLAGPNTTVIICSDHGFHPDHLRPLKLPNEPAGPAAEHRHFGMVALNGPGIKHDTLIYGSSLLDITPTILSLFGLPIGRDMDGVPLVQAFSDQSSPAYIDSWEAVEGESGMLDQAGEADPWAEQAIMDQMVKLGYIDAPDEHSEKAIESCTRESQYYLGRVYLHKSDYDHALPIFEELTEKNPDQNRFGLRLAMIYQTLERHMDSRKVVEAVIARLTEKTQQGEEDVDKNQAARRLKQLQPQVDLLRGQLLLEEGESEQALEYLERVQQAAPRLPNLHLQLGRTYLQKQRFTDAEEAYFNALQLDPENAYAYHGLASVYLAMKRFHEAEEAASASIGLIYHNPGAHHQLGIALFRLGQFEAAEKALGMAVAQAPGMRQAHQQLISLYQRYLHDPAKAEKHRRFLDENIRDMTGMTDTATDTSAESEQKPNIPLVLDTPESMPTHPLDDSIIVVSGLPRSGTSMMMQMLHAGGCTLLIDEHRQADDNNPRGYQEYEKVKVLAKQRDWLQHCKGRTVKIIAQLLPFLPTDLHYRVIFMERDLDEVLSSQQTMLDKLGKSTRDRDKLKQSYIQQLARVKKHLNGHGHIDLLTVSHRAVIDDPVEQAERVKHFLDGVLDHRQAAAAVERTLYRSRA